MCRKNSKRTVVTASRWIAYQTLADWRAGRGFLEDLLADHWKTADLKREDLALSQTIVYGVFRNLRRLDFWIDRLARKGIGSLPDPVVDCLRMALFQSAHLDRVPDHAAVSETLRLCESVGLRGMKPVVNGMLRAFPGKRGELDKEIAASPDRLAVVTSHPDWLVEWAIGKWGNRKGEVWLTQNNVEPSICLRPNAARLLNPEEAERGGDRDRTAAALLVERSGMGELVGEGTAVRIPPSGDPAQLEALREGLANVQDLSAQQAVRLLDPKPGEKIFDLCAAPGGKAVQIADRTLDRAEVYAVDVNQARLARVEENLKRCGFASVKTVRRDLSEPWEDPPALADAVLLDAPCSGLGTLRRRVDLRYRIRPADIQELAAKAGQLLENASRLARPGGRLVYSTCTLTREENSDVIEGFLNKNIEEWELSERCVYPGWLEEGPGDAPDPIPDCDGAFMALLLRRR
jgi:16S rRNA (cytosine967-C5)-methyltransferase